MRLSRLSASATLLLRVFGLLVALMILVGGVSRGVSQARSDSDSRAVSAATTVAAQKGAAIEEYFGRARSILLIAAQNPAFRDYYEAPNKVGTIPESPMKTAVEIRAALAYFHTLYPDSIGEVCFIDRTGAERARVVGGVQASGTSLSVDESSNVFFLPTLSIPSGDVYQAAPYISSDTHDWVISNSTPISDATGKVTSLLHFEISIESFRHLLSVGVGSVEVQLVDSLTGSVVVDSEVPQLVGAPLGDPDDGRIAVPASDGMGHTGGRRLAFRHIFTGVNNLNHWTVAVPIEAAPVSLSGIFNAITIAAVAVAAAIVLLVVVSIRMSRARRLAAVDDLTGLANRSEFLGVANRALTDASDTGSSIAVLVLDLDRFKEVNDSLGHHAGDDLLRSVGPRIANVLRNGDVAARFGGDEFAVMLHGISSWEHAELTARRVLEAIHQPVQVGDMTVMIEVSIGIALSNPADNDIEILLQQADVAMYAAKRDHLGVSKFAGELALLKPDRLGLFGELKFAIETGGLEVYYQPKVSLVTGRPDGAEALIRWNHPNRGLLNPADFIALAESSSLIGPLTTYVVRDALAACASWSDRGWAIPVSVNVSARSLRDATFQDTIRRELLRSGVHPSMLVLEITESSIMTDPVQARRILTELHNIGIQVSIDDFGTGYSSLAYLTSLPIDELKIDLSFVMNISSNLSDSVVARTIVDLGRNLGLRVVAEGVEDARTAEILTGFGCDVGQGYFWGRPQPLSQVTDWFAARLGMLPALKTDDLASPTISSQLTPTA